MVLFALVRRFSTSNLETCSLSRADLGPRAEQQHWALRTPSRLAFDARSLRLARTSS